MNKLQLKAMPWTKLWLMVTLLLGLWFLIAWPIRTFSGVGDDWHMTSMKADYTSGKCQAYIDKPWRTLAAPPFSGQGGNCWFIYTTRSQGDIDDVPFTWERAQRNHQWQTVKRFAKFFGTGLINFLLSAGGLYAVGWLAPRARRLLADWTA